MPAKFQEIASDLIDPAGAEFFMPLQYFRFDPVEFIFIRVEQYPVVCNYSLQKIIQKESAIVLSWPVF